MAEASRDLEGPDFEKGCDIDEVQDGGMLLGHAFGEAILVVRQGSQLLAGGGELNSGSIDAGANWRHTFSQPGTFPYFCTFHREMKGTVIVK